MSVCGDAEAAADSGDGTVLAVLPPGDAALERGEATVDRGDDVGEAIDASAHLIESTAQLVDPAVHLVAEAIESAVGLAPEQHHDRDDDGGRKPWPRRSRCRGVSPYQAGSSGRAMPVGLYSSGCPTSADSRLDRNG